MLTEDHGPANHLDLLQLLVLFIKHRLSVAGLLIESQNNSLTSLQATRRVSTSRSSSHDVEHYMENNLSLT